MLSRSSIRTLSVSFSRYFSSIAIGYDSRDSMTCPALRNAGLPVIVCALDENYAMCTAVMLKSVELALPTEAKVEVCLLEGALSSSAKQRIIDSLNTGRIKLRWVHVDDTNIRDLAVNGHVSRATYYRLLVEELLPEYDRVIYLDADIIVNTDIRLLWDSTTINVHVLAAPQISPNSQTAGGTRGLRTFLELGIDPTTRLFNAGVLVINLQLWRQDQVGQSALAYLRKYADKILWWDQDALNAVLVGKWAPIGHRWNLLTSLFRYYPSWTGSPFTREEYDKLVADPSIIHFNSSPKPWETGYSFPFRDRFFEVLDQTQWCGWRPADLTTMSDADHEITQSRPW